MTINFASIFLPVLTAALSGVFLFILNKYIGRRVEARDLRLVAIRTWQDDLYTFADLLNHAGCHGQWPGPPDSFWSPSADEAAYRRIADHVRREASSEQWARVTAARRTLTFMLAKWQLDQSVAQDDPGLLTGAFDIIEKGRVALGGVDARFRTSARRDWRDDCSIWDDIRSGGF